MRLRYPVGIILIFTGLLAITGVGIPHQEMSFLPKDTIYSNDTSLFDSCHQARPVCGDSTFCYYIPLNVVVYSIGQCCPEDTIDPYGYPVSCCIPYDSLCGIMPANPHWFFFKVDLPGNLMMTIRSNPHHPFTWVAWGPFDTPHGACMQGLAGNHNLIAGGMANFLTYYQAQFTVPDAQAGQYFLLNIGHAGDYTYMHITQTNAGEPGAASLDCEIITQCNIFELTANPGTCNPQTNTFSLNGEAFFSNPPVTGHFVIWDNTTGYSVLYPPPFISPLQYSIPNLPCDNTPHILYAAFWDSPGCESNTVFQSPVLCPDATIAGGGAICNNGIDSIAINITFTPNIQLPVTFVINHNGIAQPPITSNGPFPFSFYTSLGGLYTLNTSYNADCIGLVAGQAHVVLNPLPQPQLGTEISSCEGRPVIIDAGPGYSKYHWNTDESTQTIQVNYPGKYWVEVQGSNGCLNSDTVEVRIGPKPSTILIHHK